MDTTGGGCGGWGKVFVEVAIVIMREALDRLLWDEYGTSQVGLVLQKRPDGNGMKTSPGSVAKSVERLISTIDS